MRIMVQISSLQGFDADDELEPEDDSLLLQSSLFDLPRRSPPPPTTLSTPSDPESHHGPPNPTSSRPADSDLATKPSTSSSSFDYWDEDEFEGFPTEITSPEVSKITEPTTPPGSESTVPDDTEKVAEPAFATKDGSSPPSLILFGLKICERDLMSFLSSVPESQRAALFQSLLFEACGRTVNPANGAVGLLWTGNWHVCQSAVETVLRGGSIRAMPELFSVGSTPVMTENDDTSEAINCNFDVSKLRPEDLNLRLTSSGLDEDIRRSSGSGRNSHWRTTEKRRAVTPSDASETTTLESRMGSACSETKLLRLFL